MTDKEMMALLHKTLAENLLLRIHAASSVMSAQLAAVFGRV